MKFPAAILGLIAALLLGYFARGWLRNRLISATGKAPSCLAMLGNTTSEQDGLTYIVGSIKNNCDAKFSNVTISFKLDSLPGPTQDLPEAGAYAYSTDVAPGETRQFKTALPVSRNSTYRFDGINAY